jgi:hypothetical protein
MKCAGCASKNLAVGLGGLDAVGSEVSVMV